MRKRRRRRWRPSSEPSGCVPARRGRRLKLLIKQQLFEWNREAAPFALGYAQAGPVNKAEQRKGGFMSIAERNDTVAFDQSLEDITADSLRNFMRDVSAPTMREISDLITELESLRDKLRADGIRAERELLEYARLGQSATQLASIASQTMAGV